MLIYNGQIIAGGGTIVLPMTRTEYEANKTILDSADVWVDLTDEPDQVAEADQIAYSVDGVQKGMNYIGDIATKAIAKVEPTDTALYLHEVGTGFINKDGNYCITDVQIPVNGTITLGANCHVVGGGISGILSEYEQRTYHYLAGGQVTSCNLPKDWNELNILLYVEGSTYRTITFQVYRQSWLRNTSYQLRGGYYVNSGNNAGAIVDVSTGNDMSLTISINNVTLAGVDVTSTSKMDVIYTKYHALN